MEKEIVFNPSERTQVEAVGTPLKLANGQEYSLSYDFNALIEIEEKFGSMEAGMDQLNTKPFTAIRFFIWAGLRTAAPELTLSEVGGLCRFDNIDAIRNALEKALTPADNETTVKLNATTPKNV